MAKPAETEWNNELESVQNMRLLRMKGKGLNLSMNPKGEML